MEAQVVAIATKVKGVPVKFRLTREEEFYTAFVRQGLSMHMKMGCDQNGKLLAKENSILLGRRRVYRIWGERRPGRGLQWDRTIQYPKSETGQHLRVH